MDEARFTAILKKNGYTVTKVRKAIYAALVNYNRPIGISTLVNSLSSQADRASVYRNINIFESIGIVNKVYTGWKYRLELSEKFRPHHHHMTCNNCGVIVPVELGVRLESEIARLGRKRGFKVKNHEVELRGLCRSCR